MTQDKNTDTYIELENTNDIDNTYDKFSLAVKIIAITIIGIVNIATIILDIAYAVYLSKS